MDRQQETTGQLWGTLEELLLACAVSRHGTKRWDSVAVEVQKRRSSALPSLTPQLCKDRFNDLKRRHASVSDADLVDQLRRIRVEELRREVQRHDDSILSLELKVKRLEEERAKSPREEADLERTAKLSLEIVGGNAAAVDDFSSERDDRSFNESNSTSQRSQPSEAAVVKNEENDAVEVEKEEAQEIAPAKSEMVEPEENKESDSVRVEPIPEQASNDAEENKKQNSDVLSTASLSKKKRRRRRPSGSAGTVSSSGEEPEGDEVSPANKRFSAPKSEPLARIIGTVRSHRLGSVFERRQRSQESERYRKLIRQHMDLQIIQCRLDRGTYSDCLPKFFRDLLLLFNNFIIFYRKTSPEHAAAQELRLLVQKEMKSKLRKASFQPVSAAQRKHKPENVSSSKPNKVSTLVTFGRRTSMQESSENAKKGDKKGRDHVEEKPKANEKKIGGSLVKKKRSKELSKGGHKSSRTSSKGGETQHAYGGNELSSHDGLELKMAKKNLARKKRGVASFLRRMTQNSPSKELHDDDSDEDNSEVGRKGKRSKKVEASRERVTRSSGGRGAREENGKLRRGGIGRQQKRGRDRNSSHEAAIGSGGRAKKRSKR